MVHNRSTFWDLWHLELADWLYITLILIGFKIGCELRVLPLEIFKLWVSHGSVEAIITKLGQHVTLWNLSLVLDELGLRLSRLRLGTAIVLRSTWICNGRCTTLNEEIKNLWFVLFLGIEGRGNTFFVLQIQVSSLINQKLDHFKAISIDGVIDWSLTLGVGVVEACPEVDKLLCRTDVTFSDRIVDRRLPILVLSVDNVSSMATQEIDDFGIAFTSCIEKRRLLQ